MDETLVRCLPLEAAKNNALMNTGVAHKFSIKDDGVKFKFVFKIRPHVQQMLENLSQNFDLVVYSMG